MKQGERWDIRKQVPKPKVTSFSEKKKRDIEAAQDRKEKSIRESSVKRDAIMAATAIAEPGWTRERLEQEYVYWTKYFSEVYGV